MIIKIANLSNGVHWFDFDKSVEDLGLEDSFIGSIKTKVKLDKAIHQIILSVEAKSIHKFVCDRCACDSESELDCSFQLVYIFSSRKQESEDSNVKFLTPEIDLINFSEDLIEYLRLSLPMKNVCKEDCKGLCPVCGNNLNKKECKCKMEIVNDIWEPLKKLKDISN
jgi:uncharacterized protein